MIGRDIDSESEPEPLTPSEELWAWWNSFAEGSPPPEVWAELIIKALQALPYIANAMETAGIEDSLERIAHSLEEISSKLDEVSEGLKSIAQILEANEEHFLLPIEGNRRKPSKHKPNRQPWNLRGLSDLIGGDK